MIENTLLIDRVIRTALEEDLGAGDLTTNLTVEPDRLRSATLLAREGLVLAGIAVFSRVFELLCPDARFVYFFGDGDTVPAGEEICRVSGPVRAILEGERTALNFLQRMSGIATMTRAYVEKCAGSEGPRLWIRERPPPGSGCSTNTRSGWAAVTTTGSGCMTAS